MAALVKAVPQKALELAMTDLFLLGFKQQLEKSITIIRMLGNIACAGITGVIVNILLYPLDVVRTRLAKDTGRQSLARGKKSDTKDSESNDTGYSDDTETIEEECFDDNNNNTVKIEEPKNNDNSFDREKFFEAYNSTSDESCLIVPTRVSRRTKPIYNGGVFHVMNQIRKEDGISGLYQGLGISVVGAFMYVGLKLGLVEFFDDDTFGINAEMSKTKYYFYVAVLSWLCSCVSGFICYPIETVRRKMMVERYEDWKDCMYKIWEEGKSDGGGDGNSWRSIYGGYKAFFNGCMANFVLSITSMMIITLYKIMKDQIFQYCI